MLEKKIIEIKTKAVEEINKAESLKELFDLEKKYLGRKSEFNEILKNIKNLSEDEKRNIGQLANLSKKGIENHLGKMKKILGEKNVDFEKERIDVTIPGKKVKMGHLHILSQVRDEIEDIFSGMGFEIADGPEVETEFYNFDALNMPKDHPARDMQDTFCIKQKAGNDRLVLRTHTSNVQVRYMESHKPPIRIIAPGKTFRREATDAKHEHTFYQFEALVVGNEINVANFKYIAKVFFE
ncbi:MAG: phenylalanine--tRNA ligase subunit alpha, partial [bacterium]|nr:phenylalanine--tRNA ligase subunit alpha [bacterium]